MERINGSSHPMRPGTVTLILPFQFHEIHSTGPEPLVLLNCMFGLELLLTQPTIEQRSIVYSLLQPSTSEPYVLHLNEGQRTSAEALFLSLLQEYESAHKYRQTMVRLKLLEFIIQLDRFRTEDAVRSKPSKTLVSDTAQQLLLYVHQNFREELTLEQLCKHFHVSRTYLCALLRETTGKTFVELLHEVRIRHACSLLLSSDLTIEDITAETGFQSTNTLYRVFKKIKGMTPTKYRESHQLS